MEDSDWTELPCSKPVETEERETEEEEKNIEKENLSVTDQQDGDSNKEIEICEQRMENTEFSKKPAKLKQEKESCPICLSSFEDRCFLDQCFHSFCFCCILQWCEVVQTCPLCKSEFASVIHNIKSMQDYEQYVIEKKSDKVKASTQTHVEVIYDQNGFDGHGNRFRYRTTRQVRVTNRSTSHSQHPQHSFNISASQNRQSWGDEARRRRLSRHRHRNRRNEGIEKRRQVYAFKLRATRTSESGRKKCRNISSKFYKSNPACTHRLIPWLLRDLKVLLGDTDDEVNFLVEFILSLITRIDMESREFIEELRPFLLQTTEHFVHELLSYAKSPFDIVAYDESVVYPWPVEDNSHEESRQMLSRIPEERTDRRLLAEHSGERANLDHCRWSDTSNEFPQEHEDYQPHRDVQSNENIQPNSVKRNMTAEITETSSSTVVTNDDGRIHASNEGVESGRTRDYRSSHEDLRIASTSSTHVCDSAKRIRDSMNGLNHRIHSSSNNSLNERRKFAALEDEGDTSHCSDLNRHKRHKHGRHKHKHKHKCRHKRKSKHKTSTDREMDGLSFCVPSTSSGSPSLLKNDNVHQDHFVETGETHCERPEQPDSPTIERMLNEIDELNVRIQQHEEQLLSLDATKMQ